MSALRGVYRGAYSVLVDDPDFRSLTPIARHVLMTMRWSKEVGIACMWLLDRPMLGKRTGYDAGTVEAALLELSTMPSLKRPWIYLDDDLCWLRNGLRFDPTTNLANPKHREGVRRAIAALPRSPLIAKFCRYYEMSYPSDTHTPTHAKRSRRPRHTPPIIPNPNPKHEARSSGPSDGYRGSGSNNGTTAAGSEAELQIIATALNISVEEVERRQLEARERGGA